MSKKQTEEPSLKIVLAEVRSVKGMVLNQGKQLKSQREDIDALKRHNEEEALAKKVAKEAVEEYKKNHPEYNSTPEKTINEELIKALKQLGLVIAFLVSVIIALKVTKSL